MSSTGNPFGSNPFGNVDFTKMMADFKMPAMDVEALMKAQRANLEAFAAANQLAAEGLQAVARRHGEILRDTLEEMANAGREMMGQSSPEAKLARQAEIGKSVFERMLANMSELSELMMKSNSEAMGIINKRVSEILDEVKDEMSKRAAKK